MAYLELHSTARAEEIEERGLRAIGSDFLAARPAWATGVISSYDARFLAGIARYANPARAVEIGVASGWSSAVLLKSTSDLPGDRDVIGIDLLAQFYLDPSKATGQAVDEVVPDLTGRYRLHTGRTAFDVMPEIGKIDFAFIDGHHMHPWATLDMLSVLPFIERGRWVALHDLSLCTFERHRHTNRGPFYLFYMWPDRKLHSTQQPTMIGAIQIERAPTDYLPVLLEILYTPWEIDVRPGDLARLGELIGRSFGGDEQRKFDDAFRECSDQFKARKEALSCHS